MIRTKSATAKRARAWQRLRHAPVPRGRAFLLIMMKPSLFRACMKY
nr:MAG TPA: hypothetical protein [Caudoviricetes sp.]